MQLKPVLVTLVQAVIDDTASDTLSPRNCRNDEYQTIEQKLTKIVYGDESPSGYSEQSYVFDSISLAFEFIVENDKGEKIPPMWTPISVLSKAAAIEVLFPRKVESIGYLPDGLPPPQLIIIYDAAKACDIIELTKDFTQDIYRLGFFDNIDPTNTRVICKSYKQFCDLPEEKKK
ncbi:thioredoxin domain-containing protein 6 [Sarracenia purpurea var. burkii]